MSETKKLKSICPNCNAVLYAYSHTSASDHQEITQWYVECSECVYEDNGTYSTIDEVYEYFGKPTNNVNND
jgi:hypothetical protein